MKTIFFTLLTLLLLLPGALPAVPYFTAGRSTPYVPEYGPVTGLETTRVLPLSGSWRMKVGDEEWQEVHVPGSWPTAQGSVVLMRTFNVNPIWIGGHHRLVFWGVRPNAAITLNGRLLHATEGDWPTLTVDVPADLVRFDAPNELRVEFDDRFSARDGIPLKPKLYDPQTWSGLFADVLFVSGPTITVEDIRWSTSADTAGPDDWSLSFRLRDHGLLGLDSLGTRDLAVSLDLIDPNGETVDVDVDERELALPSLETAPLSFSGSLKDAHLWSPASPRLYTLRIHIAEGEVEYTVPLRVGFRSFTWEDGQFHVNGRPMELRGIDYRQESTDAGAALTVEQIESDLQRIRKQGFNLVRVIGSPPHPVTLEICDRAGLLLIPATGARGVPLSLLVDSGFSSRLTNMMRRMIALTGNHPSVLGWGVMDWAPMNSDVIDVVQQLRMGLLGQDDPPLIVGFAGESTIPLPDGVVGLRQRVPYLFEERLPAQQAAEGAWLAAGLGALATPLVLEEDSLESQLRQSDAVVRQINAVREMPVAGFLIDSYNDRRGALPLLIAGAQSDPSTIRRGLVTADREERIAWQRMSDLMGQMRVDVPVVDTHPNRFPVEFPIATLIVGGLLLLVMRQNNVFRHNLKRVFAHTHGFFTDIVERRYFQSGQTLFIALIFSATHGILLASLLNHSRFQFGLDYIITLLVPFTEAKSWLVYGAWHPLHAMIAFTLIVLLLLVLSAVLLRLVSLPFPGRLRLRHAIALVVWSGTCFLPLIPLGLVYHRLLGFGWFEVVQLLIFLFFWVWYFVRLAGVVRVGFRVSPRSAWLLILLFVALTAGTLYTLYLSGFAIMDYVRYYADVILPWVEAVS